MMTEIEALYIREKAKMLHSCNWKGLSKEDIKDAIDESFTKILEQLGPNANVEQFRELWWREYNNQISKCTYEKKRYKNAKEMLNTDDALELDDDEDFDSVTEQPRAESVIERVDTSDDVAERMLEEELFIEAIQDLPPHLAEIMFLKYSEHLSNAEIAQELHITEKVVEKYLSQGRKQIDPEKFAYGKKRFGRQSSV